MYIRDCIKQLLRSRKLYRQLTKILKEFIKKKIDKDGDLYQEMESYTIIIWIIINWEGLILIWCLKDSIKWCKIRIK